MILQAIKDDVIQGVSSGFAALATVFIKESLEHMVPWLIATAAVIFCDLCFGIRKSMMMGEEIRISKAARRTMGKMVTYFSFVCMVCMIGVAVGGDYGIEKWTCLLVCAIEFSSILSNILKPKGYDLNMKELISLILGKALKTDKDLSKIIEKEEKEEKR